MVNPISSGATTPIATEPQAPAKPTAPTPTPSQNNVGPAVIVNLSNSKAGGDVDHDGDSH